MATWELGQKIRSTAVYTDIDGNLVDPTIVIFKAMAPSGTETWYSNGSAGMTNPGTGTYYVEYTPGSNGLWHRRWESSGNLETADEGIFWIRDSQFD